MVTLSNINREIIVYLCILGCLIGLYLYGRYQKKLRQKELVIKLKKTFGEIPKRQYEDTEFRSISHYFLSKKDHEDFTIDDITWNDVDMDKLFSYINNTQSSAGEEYLYYRLRTPLFSKEELENEEKLINYFDQNEEERINFQTIFHSIGHTVRISLASYLDSFQKLEDRSNTVHYLCILILLASVVLFIINPGIGIAAIIVAIIINILKYYSVRGEIDSYFVCISYLVRLVAASVKLGEMSTKDPNVNKYIEDLKENVKPLKKMISMSSFVGPTSNFSGNIFETIFEYVRMLFHIDLITFNYLLKIVKNNKEHISKILVDVGQLETAIAIASFRRTLPFYAVPNHFSKNTPVISIKDGYHPLISEPVANSIEENRSVLLTGSNASGKSTFLKTVAISAILSQTIHTVPAKSYESSFFRIYSSMALRDNLENNESYYIVEIKSLKRIMDDDGKKGCVLCFVDEVLRGTNTVERVAASAHILHHLANTNTLCFAATHDIELTFLLENEYANYHFKEEIIDNDICFNYILNKGRATTRNAIKLLKIMGYNEDVIAAAEETARRFVDTGEWKL